MVQAVGAQRNTRQICEADDIIFGNRKFYAAIFNGLKFIVSAFPTVCTVGYKYIVGFADF